MNMVAPLPDDDDDYHDEYDEDSDDPLYYPGYARARIVSVHHSGATTWCVVAYIDEPGGGLLEMSEKSMRIIDQYEAARRRQSEAQALAERRWIKPAAPPAPAEPPAGKLTARREEFCRHYVTQPVAARAAVLAGYSEDGARRHGSRLLHDPEILDRIAQLRAERNVRYVVEADTLHDKIEAIFFEALSHQNHAAAIAALRLQAGLAQLPTRASAHPRAEMPKPGRRARNVRKRPQRARKKSTKVYK